MKAHPAVWNDFLENSSQLIALKLDASGNLVTSNQPFLSHLSKQRMDLGKDLNAYLGFASSEQPEVIFSEIGQKPIVNLMRLYGANAVYGMVAYAVENGETLLIGEKRVASQSEELEMMASLTNDIANISRELKRKNRELEKANITITKLTQIDMLTQIANRRYFFEQFSKHFSVARRHAHPLSVVMMDIDHFKRINDTYGHQAGDTTLAGLSGLLRTELRHEDLPARYGGEEFVVSLPFTDATQGVSVIERLREKIQAADFMKNRQQVTASFGLAQFHEDKTELDLINRADQALYKAKESGRNRVVMSER
ncbi:MAG: GGDEF domain-containing protein [Myxococcota bacterium]|nr:GGDEF domain-containing protein [Myxococcota bacterium]